MKVFMILVLFCVALSGCNNMYECDKQVQKFFHDKKITYTNNWRNPFHFSNYYYIVEGHGLVVCKGYSLTIIGGTKCRKKMGMEGKPCSSDVGKSEPEQGER